MHLRADFRVQTSIRTVPAFLTFRRISGCDSDGCCFLSPDSTFILNNRNGSPPFF